jgi:exodeoxyribonuclease VII small subunit
MSNQEVHALGLEAALGRIEEITRLLDRSDLELDEALALYEEGVHLLRTAEGFLSRAEKRIYELRQVGEGYVVEPLAGEP